MEILLLGAGSSVEAGIPGSYDMTRKISESLSRNTRLDSFCHLVSYVIGGLLFRKGIQGDNPLGDGVDIEELINTVHLLAERDALEIATFVGNWHPMIDEFDKIRYPLGQLERLFQATYNGIVEQMVNSIQSDVPVFADRSLETELENSIERMVANPRLHVRTNLQSRISQIVIKTIREWLDRLRRKRPSGTYDFGREFSNAVERLAKSGKGRVFKDTLTVLIHELISIAWIEDANRVLYLDPILGILNTQKCLTIATLNYDNCIELLANFKGMKLSTGIDDWSKTGSFRPPADGIFLLKLHGSIDWEIKKNQRSKERPIPHTIVHSFVPQTDKDTYYDPAIIFGQRNKLTAEGPFLELLRSFKQRLAEADKLTIIGYSFRDPHINIFISDWLNEDSSHRILIVDPKTTSYADSLVRYCPSRVELLNATAGTALQQLYTGQLVGDSK